MTTDIGAIRYTIEADKSQLVTAGEATDQFKIESLQAKEAVDSFRVGQRAMGQQARRTAKDVKTYATVTETATRQTQNAARAAKTTKGSFGAMKGATSQLSFQLQDVAVQAQMGTDAFIILGQQGPQIASIFGPGGAVIGALLAVGAILGGVLKTALIDTTEATESYTDKMREAVKETEKLGQQQRLAAIRQLKEEIEAQQQVVDRLAESIRGEAEAILARTDRTRDYIGVSGRERDIAQDVIQATQDLAARREVESDVLDRLREKLNEIVTGRESESEAAEKQAEKLQELVTQLEREADMVGKTARQKALYEAATLGATEAEIKRINAAFDTIDAYEAEQEALASLEKEQQTFLSNLLRTMQQEEDARNRRIEQLNREADAQERARQSATGQLVQELMTPAERERQRFQERMSVLEEAQAQELDIIGGYQAAKERLEKEHADRMASIEQASNENKWDILSEGAEARLTATESIFGNLADIAQAGGKKSFEAYKQLASAEALVAGSLAFLKALASAPPPLNFILAGTVAATTAVQIAQIQNQEYDGARALGGQMQPGGRYLVGESGPEIVSMGGGVPAHVTPNDELGMGGGRDISVTNVWQISTGVQDTVRAEIQSLSPAIAEQSKKAVLEAINNGGAMSKMVRRRA